MALKKTSSTHPIRVDFVDSNKLKLKGRLGMTIAPGKKQPSGASGHWDRDLDEDLKRLREVFGTGLLVSLVEEHEFEALLIPTLRERVKDYGIKSIWFPLCDQSVPSSVDDFNNLVYSIVEAMGQGQTIVVHCMGGLGRSGLVAAACLVAALGLSPENAIEAVRDARSGTIETMQQELFIFSFAAACVNKSRNKSL